MSKTRPSLDGATEAQILINRLNAQESTGPRTNCLSCPRPQKIMTLLCKTKPISVEPKQMQVIFW